MLRTRVLTALVLLPIVGVAVFFGGLLLAVLVALILALAYYEFADMMGEGRFFHGPFAVGLLLVIVLALDAHFPQVNLAAPALTFTLIITLGWQVLQRGQKTPATTWCISIAGAVYLGWLGRYLILLRDLPLGLQWLIIALVTTWITDAGAYFVGRAFGRHKMAPRLSPKKTWEGAVGGWIIGVVAGLLLGLLLGLGWKNGLMVGILTSTVAPFGDLAVSMFKRQVGTKDTGKLLPGHGGMWDRLDSPLFVVPVIYFYALWFAAF